MSNNLQQSKMRSEGEKFCVYKVCKVQQMVKNGILYTRRK